MAIDPLTHRDLLTYRGGQGEPLVLVHGLMGRGTTWSRQIPWLTRLGAVYTYDALWHRGRDVNDPHPISTERFVADLADAVGALGAPARLVGHSMGALHSWCLAAERPDMVSALVVEDMAPDFRGRTTGPWEPWLHALPVEFDSAEQVFGEFGPVAGQYFVEAFDRTPTGWRSRSIAMCDRMATAWSHIAMDRDRRGMGYPRLLGALAGSAGAGAAHRGGQFGRTAGPDARDDQNQLSDKIFARSRGRPPDSRRRAAGLPGGRRVLLGYPSPASANRPSTVRVTRPSASSESSARSRCWVSVSHATSSWA
jgi:pimeloyl-ACP methyl ester carboxylesterase